jgi:phosphoglucosamine mutase
VAGLAESGVDVWRLGVIPTPAVAYLTDVLDADFGVMLSASHNPAPDNGIKFFARGGVKLADKVEAEIEAKMAATAAAADGSGPGIPAAGFGRITDAAGEAERYLEHLLSTVRPAAAGAASSASPAARPLAGWRVVVDCAHGAAYALAPRMLAEAGADVIAIGVDPDGININDGCGSTSLGTLQAAVVEYGADAGIAYDGDADRCLAVDAAGEVVDGDQILAILALALNKSGRLAGGTVVATVMANLGFRLAMRDAGIDLVETPVGDRYLIAAMLDGKYVLGGEQSGHIIMLDHSSTGDGMLTSLQLLATAASTGQSLAELGSVMTRVPQVLINVHGVSKQKVVASDELAAAVADATSQLGDSGRVLVRPSGTEPAVRVMVEAVDSRQAHDIADRLADVVRAAG